jgi:hypothetical protein
MNPAFEAAKAEIEAGSNSEEIARAVLGEYEKANEQFTLSRRNAVLEQKTSREAKEQATAKALAQEQALLRSRMSGKGKGKGEAKGEDKGKGKGEAKGEDKGKGKGGRGPVIPVFQLFPDIL